MLLLIASLTLFAQEKAQEITVKGEIIDTKCYLTGMLGGRGPEHEDERGE